MNFLEMTIENIRGGKDASGVFYLESFLKEYTSIFPGKVNPGCSKCLTEYLNRYKNHFKKMENKCAYKLHKKYENIPLEFGSDIVVNNANITNELALKLLEHKNGARYFEIIPEQAPAPVVTKESLEKEVEKADKKLKALKKDAPAAKKEAAEKALADAKAALEAFVEPTEEETEEVETTILKLTQELLDENPDLADQGYKVGDEVKADLSKYEVDGVIVVVAE